MMDAFWSALGYVLVQVLFKNRVQLLYFSSSNFEAFVSLFYKLIDHHSYCIKASCRFFRMFLSILQSFLPSQGVWITLLDVYKTWGQLATLCIYEAPR